MSNVENMARKPLGEIHPNDRSRNTARRVLVAKSSKPRDGERCFGSEALKSRPALPAYSYNMGHGDFSFGRLIDLAAAYDGKLYVDNVTGIKLLQSNVFEHINTFPFQKLPLEIRRNVYRQILLPFFLGDGQTILFRVATVQPSPHQTNFAGDYRWYLRQQKLWRPEPNNHSLVPFYAILGAQLAEPEIPRYLTEKEYQAKQMRVMTAPQNHPLRLSQYRLEIQAPKNGFATTYRDRKADLYIEWIRQLSNVSSQMRKEIGDLIWTRVHFLALEPQAMWTIPMILRERTAIYRSIRSLDLKFALDSNVYFSNLSNFEGWCNVISQKLDIDSLTFTFRIPELTLSDGNFRLGVLTKLSSCKKLVVRNTFDIYLFISRWGPEARELSHRRQAKREKELRAEWIPRLKDLMMPKTLQRSVDTMDAVADCETDSVTLTGSDTGVAREDAEMYLGGSTSEYDSENDYIQLGPQSSNSASQSLRDARSLYGQESDDSGNEEDFESETESEEEEEEEDDEYEEEFEELDAEDYEFMYESETEGESDYENLDMSTTPHNQRSD